MTKFKHILCLSLVGMGLTSCMEDDYQSPNELADVSWHIGTEASNRNPLIVPLNKYLSFMDLSQGAISHQWQVSTDGTKFLEGNIGFGETDFTRFVADIPHTNDKTTINVWFTKPGQHQVRLRNTFARQVSYTYRPDPNNRPDYKETVYAKPEQGVFVMDTTFTVDVYDNVLVPGAKVYLDESLTQEVSLDSVNGSRAQLKLEYGDYLYFKDASTDRPNKWSWECTEAGLSQQEGEIVAFQFTKLSKGEPFQVKQTIERVNVLENKHIPTAPAKSQLVPLDIEVVGSSTPIELQEVAYIGDSRIKVALGNAGFLPADLATLTADFSLSVSNDYNGREPFSATFTPAEVVLDAELENVLYVTFNEAIYNTDVLNLSYTAAEERPLETVDGRVLDSFSQEIITPIANFLPEEIFDFNNGNELHESWYGLHETTVGTDKINFTIVPDPTDPTQKVLRVDCTINATRLRNGNLFDAPAGAYTFKAKLFIDSKSTTTKSGINMFITNEKNFDNKEFTNGLPLRWIPQTEASFLDQWGQIEVSFNSPGGKARTFSVNNNAFVGTYYLKDISLSNIQERPL